MVISLIPRHGITGYSIHQTQRFSNGLNLGFRMVTLVSAFHVECRWETSQGKTWLGMWLVGRCCPTSIDRNRTEVLLNSLYILDKRVAYPFFLRPPYFIR